jgi:hypothetical protein
VEQKDEDFGALHVTPHFNILSIHIVSDMADGYGELDTELNAALSELV